VHSSSKPKYKAEFNQFYVKHIRIQKIQLINSKFVHVYDKIVSWNFTGILCLFIYILFIIYALFEFLY